MFVVVVLVLLLSFSLLFFVVASSPRDRVVRGHLSRTNGVRISALVRSRGQGWDTVGHGSRRHWPVRGRGGSPSPVPRDRSGKCTVLPTAIDLGPIPRPVDEVDAARASPVGDGAPFICPGVHHGEYFVSQVSGIYINDVFVVAF